MDMSTVQYTHTAIFVSTFAHFPDGQDLTLRDTKNNMANKYGFKRNKEV
jgi:hypothetical protein